MIEVLSIPKILTSCKNENAPYLVCTFYKYVQIEKPEAWIESHATYCENLGVKARVLFSREGINGTVTGPKGLCERYMADLKSYLIFHDIIFKVEPSEEVALQKVVVKVKSEIVNSGQMVTYQPNFEHKKGRHLPPEQFKDMMRSEDAIVVDVRSDYEYNVGRFKNAITLDIENFREMKERLKKLAEHKNKKILTYCTGGIKCEKASAFLKSEGFEDVYQLEGGIINYAKEAGGEDFEGKCYVFDDRFTVDVNQVNPSLISRCMHCATPSARYINCANETCNDRIIVCESCGWEMEGCCSDSCKSSPDKRVYNGEGIYGNEPAKAAQHSGCVGAQPE